MREVEACDVIIVKKNPKENVLHFVNTFNSTSCASLHTHIAVIRTISGKLICVCYNTVYMFLTILIKKLNSLISNSNLSFNHSTLLFANRQHLDRMVVMDTMLALLWSWVREGPLPYLWWKRLCRERFRKCLLCCNSVSRYFVLYSCV